MPNVSKTNDSTFLQITPRESISDISSYNVAYDADALVDPEFVKLDANENTYPLPDKIRNMLNEVVHQVPLSRYPDPLATKLRQKISNSMNVDINNLLIGNGSDELLSLIFLAYFGKRVAIPTFSYPIYYHLAKVYEMEVIDINLLETNFDLPPDTYEQLVKDKPDLVIFAYPNNPTGNCFSEREILAAISALPKTLFVIDEAYHDFSRKTFVSHALTLPNVIILRTLSKAYGLAALRVGIAIATPEILDVLLKIKIPYNVGVLSQAIASAFFEDLQKHIPTVIKNNDLERKRISKILSDNFKFKVFHSDANFLFVKIPDVIDISKLTLDLLKQKVQLRFFNYREHGLYLRFSIGTSHDNDIALASLKSLLAQLRGNGKSKSSASE
ncbi:MAG: histidinol-phosphate transaminase [Rhodospirillales bacterium]|nr:histidinol-phosphate transaminase [Rhodospirillales bacterium]